MLDEYKFKKVVFDKDKTFQLVCFENIFIRNEFHSCVMGISQFKIKHSKGTFYYFKN